MRGGGEREGGTNLQEEKIKTSKLYLQIYNPHHTQM